MVCTFIGGGFVQVVVDGRPYMLESAIMIASLINYLLK